MNPMQSTRAKEKLRLVRPLSLLLASTVILAVGGCQTLTQRDEAKRREEINAHRQIAGNALETGKPEQALAELRPLVQKYPNDPALNNMMGLTQLSLRNSTKAVQYFQKAYLLDKSTAVGLNLSSALIEGGRLKDAETILKLLLKRKEKPPYPARERLYHNLALIAHKEKRLKTAERMYGKALEENPAFYLSQLQMAFLYNETKRPALGRASLEAAMSSCPVCYEVLDALTMSYITTGQTDKARELLSRYEKQENLAPQDVTRARDLKNLVARLGGGAPANRTAQGPQGPARAN